MKTPQFLPLTCMMMSIIYHLCWLYSFKHFSTNISPPVWAELERVGAEQWKSKNGALWSSTCLSLKVNRKCWYEWEKFGQKTVKYKSFTDQLYRFSVKLRNKMHFVIVTTSESGDNLKWKHTPVYKYKNANCSVATDNKSLITHTSCDTANKLQ